MEARKKDNKGRKQGMGAPRMEGKQQQTISLMQSRNDGWSGGNNNKNIDKNRDSKSCINLRTVGEEEKVNTYER